MKLMRALKVIDFEIKCALRIHDAFLTLYILRHAPSIIIHESHFIFFSGDSASDKIAGGRRNFRRALTIDKYFTI